MYLHTLPTHTLHAACAAPSTACSSSSSASGKLSSRSTVSWTSRTPTSTCQIWCTSIRRRRAYARWAYPTGCSSRGCCTTWARCAPPRHDMTHVTHVARVTHVTRMTRRSSTSVVATRMAHHPPVTRRHIPLQTVSGHLRARLRRGWHIILPLHAVAYRYKPFQVIYKRGCDEDGTSSSRQFSVVGDTFIVGCALPNTLVRPTDTRIVRPKPPPRRQPQAARNRPVPRGLGCGSAR